MAHKTIGILGGTSPESTVTYYQYITREYVRHHGDFGFPEILIYSLRFQDVINWGHQNEWNKLAMKMVAVFNTLQRAGADFGLIAANTPHIVFDQVQESIKLPLISIVEATAEAIAKKELTEVGLLGTKYTMTMSFYPDTLTRHGITIHVPSLRDQEIVNQVIYDELAIGRIRARSRQQYLDIIERLKVRGAQGIILGCTEIPLLIKQSDTTVPVFDTTRIHAQKALEVATQELSKTERK